MNATHGEMPTFKQRNNELVVGNHTLTEIEYLVGRTPFYAYDRTLIKEKIEGLQAALPEQISLHYAIKANPYPPLVNYIKPLVDGFDVASKNEMLLAIQSGMSTKDISFAGPGKSEDDIRASVVAGITLHSESVSEIEHTIAIGKQLNIKPNIAIRVNPAFELKASGMKMAGGAKPFGIDEEKLAAILEKLDFSAINFRGYHIFAGSQNLNAEAIIEAHQKTFALADNLSKLTPVPIDYFNIGCGLGIPYFPGDKCLDVSSISNNLKALITQYANLQSSKLIMELGRYIVGEAGIYVSKVVDVKESRQTTFAICDGGLHHHLANSGNFGQVIRKNYPVAVGNKLNSDESTLQTVNIVGPLCTPLDILADKVSLPSIAIGDYIVVFQSGAYGATASPQQFLSQPSLSEILL